MFKSIRAGIVGFSCRGWMSRFIKVGIVLLRCEGPDQCGVLSPLHSSRQYGQKCMWKFSRPQRKQKRIFSSGQSLRECPRLWQFQHKNVALGGLTREGVGKLGRNGGMRVEICKGAHGLIILGVLFLQT